uniref:GOLD domain-containing protein n=1 Tax=Peronospora matthiolae TaxID=2874970 RepID=A0AAV1TPR1_9STRA
MTAAADVSARVHLVAEKLQQKAQEAQRKGNDTAARALSASVSDLRQALALIAEQRHLLARRRGEGDDEIVLNEDDDVASSVHETVARLARVGTMLQKKADDMTRKGNDGAATGLAQSAAAVEKGRLLLMEQQQLWFGLAGRWEKLEDIVVRQGQGCSRTVMRDKKDRKDAMKPEQLLRTVQQMVQLQLLVTNSVDSGSGEVEDVRKELEKLHEAADEAETLRQTVDDAYQEVEKVKTMLKHKSEALEAVELEMDKLKAREETRQEEDASLLDQQRDACQAMEQLVRESDKEIQRLKLSLEAGADEVEALRVEMESLAAEKERVVMVHAEEVEELHEQLTSAMDALSKKVEENESMSEEVQTLQRQLESLTLEKDSLVKSHADEVEELRRQLEDAMASLSAKTDVNTENESMSEEVQTLQRQLESLMLEKDSLVRSYADEVEELRRQLEDAMASLSAKTDVDTENESMSEEVQMLQRQLESLTLEKDSLVKSHADEVEELRRQLEDAMASLSAKTDVDTENESMSEEVQTLQRQLESLTLEKDSLVKSHADEVEELRRQLEDAMASLPAKTDVDTENESMSEEVQMLQRQLESLTLEKDSLVKSHADEVEELRRQLEDAMASLSAKTDVDTENESMSEEVQTLQRQLESLTLEKDSLVKSHADEVEELRCQLNHAMLSMSRKSVASSNVDEVQDLVEINADEKKCLGGSHAEEFRDCRSVCVDEAEETCQDHRTTISGTHAMTETSTGDVSDELRLLQAKTEGLISDSEGLMKSCAAEVAVLQTAHRDEIEGLHRHLDSATASLLANVETIDLSSADELRKLKDDVRMITMEKDRLAKMYSEEIKRLNETYTAEVEDLRDRLNNGMTDHLADSDQGNDQVQATDELQRVYELEKMNLQAALDVLQARFDDYEDGYKAQQGTISRLKEEQAESKAQFDTLAVEKSQLTDELKSSREEAMHLAQRLDASEGIHESLVTELDDAKLMLAAKLAEQNETVATLEHCKEELRTCCSMLDAQKCECSRLKSELDAVRDAQDVRSGLAGEHLSTLTTELHDMVVVLRSSSKHGGDALRGFMERGWQSPEATELCSGLASLLSDIMSAQDQIQSIEEQLQLARSDCDNQALIIEQFLKTSDWRLFAKDDETMEEVKEVFDSDGDRCDRLAVARTNVSRWLDELELLRTGVDENVSKLNALADEKLQEQHRMVVLEESEQSLRGLVKSLQEELRMTKELMSRNHSTSMEEEQEQVARQQRVEMLEQQLATTRVDFERYRVRSHAALKKMEKRAELLNSMRKENEELLRQVKESKEQREQAVAAREAIVHRLEEEQRAQAMLQADFDHFASEKTRVIAELEEEIERLASEREQMSTKVLELTVQMQELEMATKQIEEENGRIRQAEQAAFQARLVATTSAVESAKQDLEKTRNALEVSKAENRKRQQRIESLELMLKNQSDAKLPTTTETTSSFKSVVPPPAEVVPSVASPSEVNSNASILEQEIRGLKASEVSLRKHLDDARAELATLQERFATTKAANAEKVFALQEQSSHYKMELAAVTEEVQRLTAVIQAQKRESTSHESIDGPALSIVDKRKEDEATAVPKHEDFDEIRALKAALADANSEIKLLTTALADSQEELQEAQNVLHLFAPSSIESENNDAPSAIIKAAQVLSAKEEALKKMRKQVFAMQEEVQTLQEEKAALELQLEKNELNALQVRRNQMQVEKGRTMQLQKRQAQVVEFEKRVATIVDDLQQRLEDHSRAFRDVCDFSDEHRAAIFPTSAGQESDEARVGLDRVSEPEFEECLVMRSGVVIKAGASFQLPVICEKSGWRVVWSFSVKEETADVSFTLCALSSDDAMSSEVEVVPLERTNEMSGVFHVQHDNTTLVYKWDNSFAWLQEKTLDYHVSIQEQLSPQAQTVRRTERELQARAKVLADGVALLQTEAHCRAELVATLERLDECEANKELQLAEFASRKGDGLTHKTRLDKEREAHKALYAKVLKEQDELEDVERGLVRAWEAAVAEREDAEMTLQLTGNGVQLKELAREIHEQAKVVAIELEQAAHEGKDTADESKEREGEINCVLDAENDVQVLEPEDGGSRFVRDVGMQAHEQ